MSLVLHGSTADIIEKQAEAGGYQSPEDFVFEAVQYFIKQQIENNIDQGIQDINAGKYTEVNAGNLDSYVNNIIANAKS